MTTTQEPKMQTNAMPCRTVDFSEWSKMTRVRDLSFSLRRGDLVVLRSRGSMRLARVTKVGRVRVETEYTTEAARREADRYGHAPTVTRKSVPMDDDWLRFAGRGSVR
jgi:hypothetical protein